MNRRFATAGFAAALFGLAAAAQALEIQPYQTSTLGALQSGDQWLKAQELHGIPQGRIDLTTRF